MPDDQPESAAPIRFGIDVGGTFTDCTARFPNGQRRHFKTLSSGIRRGILTLATDGSVTDDAWQTDPAGFWDGAELRLFAVCPERRGISGGGGRPVAVGRIVASDRGSGLLRPEFAAPKDSDLPAGNYRYELDPGVPAPVLGIRHILGLQAGQPVPPIRLRLGTTRGTNALLTGTGARTVAVVTRGFGDALRIGDQSRPDLFALNIERPRLLCEQVIEVEERMAADGTVLQPLSEADLKSALELAYREGIESVAVCLFHSWKNSEHEEKAAALARQVGFASVSLSSQVSREIGWVPRASTTLVDAALNPVLESYLEDLQIQLPGSDIRLMTSSGGLVPTAQFRGGDSILSGPAGGIIGLQECGLRGDYSFLLGFDMGGTSTDVCAWRGKLEYQTEVLKAGVRIRTPLLAIDTVAAGGGSICGFDGTRLFVGPDSAGATPGPVSYGAGGPLTVTDLNVWLGRIPECFFPFPLDRAAVEERLTDLRNDIESAGVQGFRDLNELALGLLTIANDRMAHAIRKVSTERGYAVEQGTLACFGGAAGLHGCQVAEILGTDRIMIPALGGLFSACGMHAARRRSVHRESCISLVDDASYPNLSDEIQRVAAAARALHDRSSPVDVPTEHAETRIFAELRYVGTQSSIPIEWGKPGELTTSFHAEHRRLFGYERPELDIECVAVRVEVEERRDRNDGVAGSRSVPSGGDQTLISAPSDCLLWDDGRLLEAPLWVIGPKDSEAPRSGSATKFFDGPVILTDGTATVYCAPGWSGEVSADGSINLHRRRRACVGDTRDGDRVREAENAGPVEATRSIDPVRVELMSHRFTNIAERMGVILRQTSLSTNIRDRLDYSCALFDRTGGLVVNAPHVPVHLGAMAETVRAVLRDHPKMRPGDTWITNDPFAGGSHLPDVTLVTPVFLSGNLTPDCYVANRAHHADIGGVVPGSMPPMSRTLAEEGVLIQSRLLVRNGHFFRDELLDLLTSAEYPARNPEENLADLEAQLAANQAGNRLLQDLVGECRNGAAEVNDYMRALQDASAKRLTEALRMLGPQPREFRDQLDDGTPLCVRLQYDAPLLTIDFSGSGGLHAGNLNANRAITTSAVLYCLRVLLQQSVPLNEGVLKPVRLNIPAGILNPPASDGSRGIPAVVGGNVETSQRIADILLAALDLSAAGQGTMNNVTFGTKDFGFYETIGGGAGATATADGESAVHVHMTNTRLTDPEILETRFPVRLRRFSLRPDSGGRGRFCGGDGMIREFEFLADMTVSLLSQRRTTSPFGLHGGHAGTAGRNRLHAADGAVLAEGAVFTHSVSPGCRLVVETPGGGGWGTP